LRKEKIPQQKTKDRFKKDFNKLISAMELGQALDYIWRIIRADNKYIEDNKPWELAKKNPKKFKKVMGKLLTTWESFLFYWNLFFQKQRKR